MSGFSSATGSRMRRHSSFCNGSPLVGGIMLVGAMLLLMQTATRLPVCLAADEPPSKESALGAPAAVAEAAAAAAAFFTHRKEVPESDRAGSERVQVRDAPEVDKVNLEEDEVNGVFDTPEGEEEKEEKKEEKPTDLIAEAQQELNRDTAIVTSMSEELKHLETLWKKVFEGGRHQGGSTMRQNRKAMHEEVLQIQKSLLTLMGNLNETQKDLTQAHEVMEQKETLEDLEDLVKKGKLEVNYETGELAAGALGNFSVPLAAAAAAAGAGKGKTTGGAEEKKKDSRSKASTTLTQKEVAAAVEKIQQEADPAMLHLDVHLLQDIVLLSVSTALCGFASTVTHLPATFGYMTAGMLIGPSGFNLISNVVQVETLAQFGSIFLLFGHGMMYCQHYHLSQLGGALSDTFAAGVLILSAIFFLTIFIYTCFVGGAQFYQATLVASAVSLSSTTTTAHALVNSRLRDTSYGKTLIELMAVQDLLMAPLLSIPTAVKELLFQYGVAYMLPILGLYGLAIALAAAVSKKLIPKIINLRSRSENSLSLDLFILGIVSYCLLMSLLTEWMGLSHEAGALLAGLVLADVPNIGKAVAVIEPLTCLFGGMYLGSLGMILSPLFLAHHAGIIFICVLVVLAIKITIVSLGMRSLGYSVKASLLGGLSLGQISELSLFLVARAHEYRLISRRTYLMVVATTIVLLVLTPLTSHAFRNVERSEYKAVTALHKSPFVQWWNAYPYHDHESPHPPDDDEDGDEGLVHHQKAAVAAAALLNGGKYVTHRIGVRSFERERNPGGVEDEAGVTEA